MQSMIAFKMFLGELGAGHERRDLLLLLHLPIDEVDDVGVVDIDDHHFGGAPRGAARFDRALPRGRRS